MAAAQVCQHLGFGDAVDVMLRTASNGLDHSRRHFKPRVSADS